MAHLIEHTNATRQQLLLLWVGWPDPGAEVVAWSVYDGAGEGTGMSGDSDEPPYASVLAAMQDGWRVIQVPQLGRAHPGAEYETSYLRFGYTLERLVEVDRGH